MKVKLYATIKRSSKYYHQQPLDNKGKLVPFEVEGLGANLQDYGVSGNSNSYRRSDMNFFIVLDNGRMVKIS